MPVAQNTAALKAPTPPEKPSRTHSSDGGAATIKACLHRATTPILGRLGTVESINNVSVSFGYEIARSTYLISPQKASGSGLRRIPTEIDVTFDLPSTNNSEPRVERPPTSYVVQTGGPIATKQVSIPKPYHTEGVLNHIPK